MTDKPEPPEWYYTWQAAKAMEFCVPPWVLDHHPIECDDAPTVEFWKQKAIIAVSAENQAENAIASNPDMLSNSKPKGTIQGWDHAPQEESDGTFVMNGRRYTAEGFEIGPV